MPLSFNTVGNLLCVISCISQVLPLVIEHGTPHARQRTLTLLLDQLPLYASDDVGVKSLLKLVKPADPDVVLRVIDKMCQPNSAAHRRRSIIVDLALSVNGSQLIQHVLPMVSPDDGKRMSIDSTPGKQGAAQPLVQQHQGTCGYSSRLSCGVACYMAIRPVRWPVRTYIALTSVRNPQYARILWLLGLLLSSSQEPMALPCPVSQFTIRHHLQHVIPKAHLNIHCTIHFIFIRMLPG